MKTSSVLGLFAALMLLPLAQVNAQGRYGRGNRDWKPYKEVAKPYQKMNGKRTRRIVKYNKPNKVYWARSHKYRYNHHVYFPKYNMFYDPYRKGYIYRSNAAWHFSRQIPSVVASVNLGVADIKILANIPLARHPEVYYPRPVYRGGDDDDDYDYDDDYYEEREDYYEEREDYYEEMEERREDYREAMEERYEELYEEDD